MANNRTAGIVMGALGIGLAAAGLGVKLYTGYQEKHRERLIRTAALDYMQEKYGVQPEIVLWDDYSYATYAVFEENGRRFNVQLNENLVPFRDNYQYDEICDAVKAEFLEHYPDCAVKETNVLTYGDPLTPGLEAHGLVLNKDTKYDGTNLEQVTAGAKIRIIAYNAGAPFADTPMLQTLRETGMGKLVTFDTQAHLDAFLAFEKQGEYVHSLNMLSTEINQQETMFAPHIRQILELGAEGGIRSILLREDEGFLYSCPKVPEATFSPMDTRKFITNYINGIRTEGDVSRYKENAVTKAYQLCENRDALLAKQYLYFPVADYPDWEQLELQTISPRTPFQFRASLTRCGEYAVGIVDGDQNQWMLARASESGASQAE